MADKYDQARLMALQTFELLNVDGTDYLTALNSAIELTQGVAKLCEEDAARLRTDLERSVNVTINRSRVLTDGQEHAAWLPLRKHELKWRFWPRYRTFLLRERQLPPRVVDRLDDISDEILGLLGDPSRKGVSFDRRGLVVGHVQSGKTTNYAALINKALDTGYGLVVVLTGLHNSLRSQTQLRLDEEVLGFDTKRSPLSSEEQGRFGVALVPGAEFVSIGSLTSWDERGDFTITHARNIAVTPGEGTPLILIVKKNGAVLRNLVRYFRDQSPIGHRHPTTGRIHVPNVPLLVIDDEADLASVNTAAIPLDDDGRPLPDYDPTVINQRIRELLNSFDQRAYVGYTATPFANIFIRDDAPHAQYGDDLFPRNFIIALPAPDNYIGPTRLLGSEPDGEGQPLFRLVDDSDQLAPVGHRRTFVPTGLPASLQSALRSFLLSSAARRARGQINVHNSMLIHVTRFTDVQSEIADLVGGEWQTLKRRLMWGDGDSSSQLVEELERLWSEDYLPTSAVMGFAVPDWRSVKAELAVAANITKVKIINGSSADVLDYRENAQNGINVIAIGGDKLSRGLTLEGLSVSYFLRATKMYDTLMQMGRWFGYRPNYEDLCRIFTTNELWTWFGHITAADEELRAEFDYMASLGATPRDYGLRVMSHPVLTVTSPLKMRSGTELQLSYAGDVSETTVFHSDPTTLDHNFSLTDRFIRGLGPAKAASTKVSRDTKVWSDIKAEEVISFLRAYRTHPEAHRADSTRLAEYIEKQTGQSPAELVSWTVALISQERRREDKLYETKLGGHDIVCMRRKPIQPDNSRFAIRRLLSPVDEEIDLLTSERAQALIATKEQLRQRDPSAVADRPSGPQIRRSRPPQRGLLLLYPLDPSYGQLALPQVPVGIGLSFPASNSTVKVSYVVNRIWTEDDTW